MKTDAEQEKKHQSELLLDSFIFFLLCLEMEWPWQEGGGGGGGGGGLIGVDRPGLHPAQFPVCKQ